jgi:hypothetical protein
LTNRFRRTEHVALDQFSAQRPARQLKGRGKLAGLGRTDAGEFGEFLERRSGQPRQVAVELGQQLTGQIDGALAPDSDAQKDRQQFGVGQGGRAELAQAFARSLVIGPVGDCHEVSR